MCNLYERLSADEVRGLLEHYTLLSQTWHEAMTEEAPARRKRFTICNLHWKICGHCFVTAQSASSLDAKSGVLRISLTNQALLRSQEGMRACINDGDYS